MIIEFMGLPGVGKSYLGKQIEKELSYRGIKCISVVERSRTSLIWKFLSKCLHIGVSRMPKYRRLRNELVDLAYPYASARARYNENTVRIANYIEQIAFLDYVYTKQHSSKNVYIYDEGIAQQFVNMIVNFGVDIEIIQSMILLLGKYPKMVYMTYSVKKIKESIAIRNRHVCYIDELKDGELNKFLISYQEACNLVSCIFKPLNIDRADDEQLNIDKIMRSING